MVNKQLKTYDIAISLERLASRLATLFHAENLYGKNVETSSYVVNHVVHHPESVSYDVGRIVEGETLCGGNISYWVWPHLRFLADGDTMTLRRNRFSRTEKLEIVKPNGESIKGQSHKYQGTALGLPVLNLGIMF